VTTAHSVYVHVPFCDVRCPYCHFTCFVNRDPELPDRWARAIVREWHLHREQGRAQRVASVYFGGGTPSALPADARERLGRWLADDVVPACDEGAESTMEANPESAWHESLVPWVEAGVNRISLGVQSMDPDVLTFLGRLNTPRSNLRALELACGLVENVSADLIVGSPQDDRGTLVRSIEAITSFPVTHVSAYLLEIHRTTRFGRDVESGKWIPKPDDDQADLYLEMIERLEARGLEAYELSNFSLPHARAQHNARYWSREPYLGLGPSAHSFEADRRWSNVRDTRAWCEAIEAGQPEFEVDEWLDHVAVRRERVLLGLRRREGIPVEWVAERQRWCEEAARAGLLRREHDRWVATPRGWLLLDQLVAELTD